MHGQVVVVTSLFAAICCGLRTWADWPGQRARSCPASPVRSRRPLAVRARLPRRGGASSPPLRPRCARRTPLRGP